MSSTATLSPPVVPDAAQAIAFFKALYPATLTDEVVHFRGVPEPKDERHPKNLHYTLSDSFEDNVRGFLAWCAVDQRAAFFLPGTVKGAGTGKAAVLSLPAILVDFDKGNPDENLAKAEAVIGPATVIVESGGRTETGPKLHAYWRLSSPATGEGIAVACSIREVLAERFSGDASFKQPAQVIRIPGSIHFKREPTLVTLRKIRPGVEVQLELIRALVLDGNSGRMGDNSKVVNFLDFNNADIVKARDVERALTAPIHEGAVDDITRFEGVGKAIGHFIRMYREGRYDIAGAWEAAKEWNVATLVPPWSEERLRGDFERLVRIDVSARGPVVPPVPAAILTTKAEGWSITDWRADRFSGPAPARRWLVEDLVPLGTPGIFAAVGDAGKSMLALQLALYITSAPPLVQGAVLDFSAPRFFGQPVIARGAAVILTAEDDADEVHRRLNSLDPSFARSNRPLYVVPMLSTGGARAVLVDGSTGPVPTDFWRDLRAELLAIPDLRLVVLDPLSSFMNGDTNDNLAGAALMTMLGELAATSGAAVMLVHHFAKASVPSNLSDARTAIRGAGALVDNGRWSIVLWEADQDDALKVLKAMGQPQRARQAGVVYFGGLAKGNAPGAKILRTMVRAPNGVLEDVTDALTGNAPKPDEIDEAIFKALCAHKQARPRWSFPMSKTSVERYIGPLLKAARIDVSLRQAQLCLDRLLERGLLVETEGGSGAPKYEPCQD